MDSILSTIKSSITDAKTAIGYNESVNQLRDSFAPLCKRYSTLHTDLAEVKKEHVFDNLTEGQRLCSLWLVTLTSAVLARKVLNRSLAGTLRFSLLSYFSSGLILYPEIYNSVFVLKKQESLSQSHCSIQAQSCPIPTKSSTTPSE